MSRVVVEWTGGAVLQRRFAYRVVQGEDECYKLEVRPLLFGVAFAPAGRFEHLAAHRLAAHFIIEDKERLEWRAEHERAQARRRA